MTRRQIGRQCSHCLPCCLRGNFRIPAFWQLTWVERSPEGQQQKQLIPPHKAIIMLFGGWCPLGLCLGSRSSYWALWQYPLTCAFLGGSKNFLFVSSYRIFLVQVWLESTRTYNVSVTVESVLYIFPHLIITML